MPAARRHYAGCLRRDDCDAAVDRPGACGYHGEHECPPCARPPPRREALAAAFLRGACAAWVRGVWPAWCAIAGALGWAEGVVFGKRGERK